MFNQVAHEMDLVRQTMHFVTQEESMCVDLEKKLKKELKDVVELEHHCHALEKLVDSYRKYLEKIDGLLKELGALTTDGDETKSVNQIKHLFESA